MLYENEKIKSHIFYYLCIVLAGCILVNILLRCDVNMQAFVLPLKESDQMMDASVRQTVLYVVFQRVKQIVILYLLYKVFPPGIVFSICMSGLMFLLGASVSLQMYYEGISGVWFLLLCLLPHYLIYLVVMFYMAVWMRKENYESKEKKIVVLFFLMLAFAIGILSESILSKIFLKNFLQYIGL